MIVDRSYVCFKLSYGMPSNKPRLYVALYARGRGPNLERKYVCTRDMSTHTANGHRFHWALIVGPKKEDDNGRGTQYHAVDRLSGPEKSQWRFEEKDIPLYADNMLLIRVAIAKVEKPDQLRDILRSVPLRPDTAGWNCVAWVQEALETLVADGQVLGTHVVDWAKVREAAVGYCDKKIEAHRFDGKGELDSKWPPTLDLMNNVEVIP